MKAREYEELAEQFFREGNNCSQSVFSAFAGDFGIDRETASKIAVGLGGGVGRMRNVCGAVSAASLVYGLRHGEDKNVVYPFVQDFCRRFKAEAGSIICSELLAKGASNVEVGGTAEKRSESFYQKRPCLELVKLAARLLVED